MAEIHDKFELSKLEAAQRHLCGAIRMLFARGDPVLVHTLAGAASTVFSDLVKHRNPSESWDLMAQQANKISAKTYRDVMHSAQNFLKHADRDPDGSILFDPFETDAIIFIAVMNASTISQLTREAELFQLWYLASRNAAGDEESSSDFEEIISIFGDLRNLPRDEQIAFGAKHLDLGLKGKR